MGRAAAVKIRTRSYCKSCLGVDDGDLGIGSEYPIRGSLDCRERLSKDLGNGASRFGTEIRDALRGFS